MQRSVYMFVAATGTAAALILQAVIVKIIALALGPSGIGIFSILRQLIQAGAIFGSLSGELGLVKGMAAKNGADRFGFLSAYLTAIIISTTVSIMVIKTALPAILGHPSLDLFDGSQVLWLSSLGVCLSVLSISALAILNAEREIYGYSCAKIAGPAVGALMVYWLCAEHAVLGVAYTLLLSLGGSMTVGLFLVIRVLSQRVGAVRAMLAVQPQYFRDILRVAGATLAVTGAGTLTSLAVRAYVVNVYGIDEAGIFDASWSISAVYIAVLLSSFGIYFLPHLSAHHSEKELENQINEMLRIAIFLAVVALSIAIVLKPVIVILLYSEEFLKTLDLLQWMLMGDFFRVVGWALSTAMIARGRLKVYILLSLGWDIFFLVGLFFIDLVEANMDAIGIFYLISHFLFALGAAVYWKIIKLSIQKLKNDASVIVLAGACVSGCAVLSWDNMRVEEIKIYAFLPAVIYVLFFFGDFTRIMKKQ